LKDPRAKEELVNQLLHNGIQNAKPANKIKKAKRNLNPETAKSARKFAPKIDPADPEGQPNFENAYIQANFIRANTF
jgi:hypothetical protein